VDRGAVEVTLTVSAGTALNMAKDIEFAVQQRPHGFSESAPPAAEIMMTRDEMRIVAQTMRSNAKTLNGRHESDGLFQNAYTSQEISEFRSRAAMMLVIADRMDSATGTKKY
jgi:hypothetical protein